MADSLVLRLDQALITMVRSMRNKMLNRKLKGDLTRGQVYILRLIKQDPQHNISDLAKIMGISLSSVSGLIHSLEQKGLIERQRSKEDRRIINIKFTSQGEHILKEMDRMREEILSKYLEHLEPEEVNTLVELVEKIVGAVSAEDKTL